MTKQEEMTILQETIDRLGEYSYLAPWLASVKDEVEALILADMQPHLTIKDAVYAAKEITFKAEEEAKRLRDILEAQMLKLEAKKHEHFNMLWEAGRKLQRIANEEL